MPSCRRRTDGLSRENWGARKTTAAGGTSGCCLHTVIEQHANHWQDVEIVCEEERGVLSYKPDWQKERCRLLGLEYINGNHSSHVVQPLLVPVSKCPSATELMRIVFFTHCDWISGLT